MKGYSQTHVFTFRDVNYLHQAAEIVEEIPEPKAPDELRCHEITRFVGSILKLDTIDGQFGAVDHSWLLVPAYGTRRAPSILDVYACGRLPMVQLIDTNPVLGTTTLYKPGPLRKDINEGLVECLIGRFREDYCHDCLGAADIRITRVFAHQGYRGHDRVLCDRCVERRIKV